MSVTRYARSSILYFVGHGSWFPRLIQSEYHTYPRETRSVVFESRGSDFLLRLESPRKQDLSTNIHTLYVMCSIILLLFANSCKLTRSKEEEALGGGSLTHSIICNARTVCVRVCVV